MILTPRLGEISGKNLKIRHLRNFLIFEKISKNFDWNFFVARKLFFWFFFHFFYFRKLHIHSYSISYRTPSNSFWSLRTSRLKIHEIITFFWIFNTISLIWLPRLLRRLIYGPRIETRAHYRGILANIWKTRANFDGRGRSRPQKMVQKQFYYNETPRYLANNSELQYAKTAFVHRLCQKSWYYAVVSKHCWTS